MTTTRPAPGADIYTVVVTVALGRTATGAPTDFDDVTVIVAADNPTDATLTAVHMAMPFSVAQMPVATTITDLIC